MIDGRETAPAQAHRDLYLDKNGAYIINSSIDGALAAGIPGTVAAMVHLSENYGVLPLKATLQPAIKLAEQGFPVTRHYQKMAQFRLPVLRRFSASGQIFLHNNQIPEPGHLIIQQALAQTLKQIAEQGHKGFYDGSIAKKLVDAVQTEGGIWQLDDLKSYHIIEREPVQFQYHDMQVISVAPPSSGGIALATILQILQNYQLDSLDKVTQIHLIIEAMQRAYRDRAEYLGDSDFVEVPQQRLSHPWYATGLAAGISLEKATPSENLQSIIPNNNNPVIHQTEGQDTSHFSIMDTQGNLVSSTMSINYPFGSGMTAAGTGVLLNDEMDDFSASPGTPNIYGLVGTQANAIAPGKRPLSSMSPTIVQTPQGVAVLGTPGGSRIITMVLLGILALEKTPDASQWVSRPRFHHQYLPDKVFFEKKAFSQDQIIRLTAMGHHLQAMDSNYGNMQAISWDYQQGISAASDPRVEGGAMVFDIP